MIVNLPRWILVNKFPALYDTESLTAIEQTARVYAKMNELVDNYNEFVEVISKQLTDYSQSTEEEYEAFKVGIRQEFQDFINTIDLKVLEIERDIETFESETNTKLSSMSNDIASFKTQVTSAFESFKSEAYTYMDTEVNKLFNEKIVTAQGVNFNSTTKQILITTA